MNQAAAFRVYDSLLGQRSREESTDDLQVPNVKLKLLSSQLMVASSLVAQIQDKQPGYFYNQLPPNVRREVRIKPSILSTLYSRSRTRRASRTLHFTTNVTNSKASTATSARMSPLYLFFWILRTLLLQWEKYRIGLKCSHPDRHHSRARSTGWVWAWRSIFFIIHNLLRLSLSTFIIQIDVHNSREK